MANIAASAKLGKGFGALGVNDIKFCCVSFATTATADVLIFDTSNVGAENAFSKITWAQVVAPSGSSKGGIVTSLIIASNQITVGSNGGAGATNVVALVAGIGG